MNTKAMKIAASLTELNAFRSADGLELHAQWAKGPMGVELTAYRTQAAIVAKAASDEADRLKAEADAEALRLAAEANANAGGEQSNETGGDAPSGDTPSNETPAEQPAPAAAKVVKAVKEPTVFKNGIGAPRPGKCLDAWNLFATCYANGIMSTTAIVEAGVAIGLNRGNLRTEISRWRKHHGIARPATSIAAPAAPVVEQKPDAPEGEQKPEGDAVTTETIETVTAVSPDAEPVVETVEVQA